MADGSNIICNGRGKCRCGQCQCDEGYVGKFCKCSKDECPKGKTGTRFVYLLSIFIYDIFDFQSMIEFVTITEIVLAKKMDKS